MGVQIDGFSVGTSPSNLTNIVQDGWTQDMYYGQRFLSDAKKTWGPIIVPPSEPELPLFLSFNPPDKQAIQLAFQEPSVYSHDPQKMASFLIDAAASGGALSPGDVVGLIVTFECREAGLFAATVKIPVYPLGEISFTIPKQCEPSAIGESELVSILKSQEELREMADFDMGLSDKEEEKDIVIKRGKVTEIFQGYERDMKQRATAFKNETQTDFIITVHPNKRGQRHFVIMQPTAVSIRPFMTPTILTKGLTKQNEDEDDADGLNARWVVGPEKATLTVVYNCIWPGSSQITLTIYVWDPERQEPVNKFPVTWTKVCPQTDPELDGADEDEAEVQQQEPEEDTYEDGYTFSGGGGQAQAGKGSNADGVYYQGDWDDHDELSWNAQAHVLDAVHNELTSTMADLQESGGGGDEGQTPGQTVPFAARMKARMPLGYINIGTAPNKWDVVEKSVASPKYSMPVRAADKKKAYKVVEPYTQTSTFFLSVPRKFQLVDHPKVWAVRKSLVGPVLTGSAAVGGNLTASSSLALTITYNCKSAGVTPILVSVPLKPYGLQAASFRIVKICPGFKKKVQDYFWTAPKLMTLFVLAQVVGALFCYYCLLKDRQNPHELLPCFSPAKPGFKYIRPTPDVVEGSVNKP
mmetsp:Transcript_45277/g.88949  ORF Transcript_45277/g.88949 Transcript_45277/m.88949 type:complete len:638 (-) Transcript_45277:85-1998(-)